MNNTELELKKIKPISSVEECIDIAKTIFYFDEPIGKYKVFQAQNFFMNNVLLFNKEDFSTVLKNKLFTRKYVQKPAYDILRKCVDEQVIYPFVLNSWFDKQVSYTLQKQYVALLDKYDNWEQLNIFNDKVPNMVNNQFNSSDNPSNSIIKIIISNEPNKIFRIKSWDDEKIAEWLKDNPKQSMDILQRNLADFKSGDLKFPKSRNQLYKNIIEEHLNKLTSTKENNKESNKFNFKSSFSSYPLDYIEFVRGNYPEIFEKHLHQSIICKDSNNSSTVNGLQSIIFNRVDSLHNLYKAFSKYKNLLKQDVKVDIGFYTKNTNFFEYCLAKEIFKPFIFFNLNDELNKDEKDILVAAAFMYFQLKYDDPSSYKVESNKMLTQWYPEIMKQCSDEQFKKYSKKLDLSSSHKMIKEFESIELSRELNSSSNKVSNTKKIKL